MLASVLTPSSPVRERDREKERKRKRERERERESEKEGERNVEYVQICYIYFKKE